MIRVAICDDSLPFLRQTKFMLDHYEGCKNRIETGLFEDGDALIAAHLKRPFDIILLDIVMPLINGLDVAKVLRETDKTVRIVFLTSSTEFAVDSYTVKASNYLLKPLDPEKLFACLDELFSEIQTASRYITVKGVAAAHRIAISDIEYIESQGKRIIFSMTGGRVIESLEPLYRYEDALGLTDGFYKCHRSYIVNIRHIDSYSHTEIITRSGFRVPISRSCQKDFENVYFRVVFGEAGDEL